MHILTHKEQFLRNFINTSMLVGHNNSVIKVTDSRLDNWVEIWEIYWNFSLCHVENDWSLPSCIGFQEFFPWG